MATSPQLSAFVFLWSTSFASLLTAWLSDGARKNAAAHELLFYGYKKSTVSIPLAISKSWFALYYLIGLVVLRAQSCEGNVWVRLPQLHCARRFVESAIVLTQRQGQMSPLHLGFGILYYLGLASVFAHDYHGIPCYVQALVAFFSVCQSLIHCMYAVQKSQTLGNYSSSLFYPLSAVKNMHYFCELAIYTVIFVHLRNSCSAANFVWMLVFTSVQSHK